MQSDDCTCLPSCHTLEIKQGLPETNSDQVIAALACIHSIAMCTTNKLCKFVATCIARLAPLTCTTYMPFAVMVHGRVHVSTPRGNKPRLCYALKVGTANVGKVSLLKRHHSSLQSCACKPEMTIARHARNGNSASTCGDRCTSFKLIQVSQSLSILCSSYSQLQLMATLSIAAHTDAGTA